MAFSVLLSLYYKESPLFLQESLNSIFNQTLLPNEIVLVEDGPLTPKLYKVLDDFTNHHAEIKRVVLEKNGGLGNALNEGLKHCSYELVARMDTDDICKSERFAKQVAFMEQHPEVDIVGAWIDEFQGNISNVISTRKLPQYSNDIREFGKKRCPMNHPVTMFRKEAVLAAGGYLPFPFFEDYYLWVRMILNGATMYNIQESLLYFRFSPEMFKRRGGWRYARLEIRFQRHIYKLKYIKFYTMISNICIRMATRIVPNGIRSWIYKKLLRK